MRFANGHDKYMVEIDNQIAIEVAYARPERQIIRPLQVAAGTTMLQAIEQSELAKEFPEIDLTAVKAGIFGKQQPSDTVLQSGDRVEIYRPLKVDPKQQRKLRAAKNKP